MASSGPQNGNIRATLAISESEARYGTTRMLTLPRGRTINVPIAPGVHNGDEIRLNGQGEPTWSGGPAGDLILTITVTPTEQYASQSYTLDDHNAATEYMQAPPPPPASASSANYPPTVSSSAYTNYPPPVQPDYAQPAQYYGSQPAYQQGVPPQPVPQKPRRRSGFSIIITILLVLLALLLIGGGVLLYYAQVYQPNQVHAQATATVQAQITGTAQANAQATAQVLGTAQAQANATNTAQASATALTKATATVLQGIYTQATSGTPALSDPLSAQDSSKWQEITSSANGTCGFTGGTYHSVIPQKGFFQPCFAEATNFSNFALQVQMTIVKGDRGGFMFRADDTNSKFYLFRISSDGTYDLFLYVDSSGSHATNLASSSSPLINKGQNSSNTLSVVAQGSNLYFYVNQQYLTGVTDSTYSSGKIGLFAENSTNPTDASFSNLKVWTL